MIKSENLEVIQQAKTFGLIANTSSLNKIRNLKISFQIFYNFTFNQ